MRLREAHIREPQDGKGDQWRSYQKAGDWDD